MGETRLDRSPWARFRADRRAMACLIVLCLEVLAVLLLPLVLDMEPNVSDLEAGFWAPSRAVATSRHGVQRLVPAGPCLLFTLPSVPCVALNPQYFLAS